MAKGEILGRRRVVGTLTGIEPKGNAGWMKYSISVIGKTYPITCETSKPETQQAMAALVGQAVAVEITDSDSGNPNQYKPGTTYTNHYLDSVAPAPGQDSGVWQLSGGDQPAQQQVAQVVAQHQQVEAQQQAQPQAQVQMSPHERAKELRIMRQNAADKVVQLVAVGKVEHEPVAMITACEFWVAYYTQGPARWGVQAFDAPAPPRQPEPVQEPLPTQPGTEPCPDCGRTDGGHEPNCPSDDIPF